MKHTRTILRSAVLLVPVAVVALSGCSSTGKGESLEAIRWNPAPGLNTEDQRYSDVHSNIHVVANDNLRKMNSDGMRFMLIDRPSRMSPYPTAH